MRQNVPLRKPGAADADTDTASRSIDEWLDAAVAEQARRASARPPGSSASTDETPDASLAAAMPAPARVPPGTAAKSGTALNSMTSWLEQAQEELADVGRERSDRPSSPSTHYDALSSVERIDSGFESDKLHSEALAAQDEAFRNLENRIREIAGRLEAPRNPASPKPAPRPIEQAIIEIRARQAALDEEQPVASPAPLPASSPASSDAPVEARPTSAPKTSLSEERPAATPRPVIGTAVPPGLEALRRDIDRVHESLETLATRSDLTALERSIATLSAEIGDARKEGGNPGRLEAEIEALQAQIQQLSATPGVAPEGLAKLERDIDIVSHKLDIVATSGVDPKAIDGLAREIAEVKGLVGGMATPGGVSDLNEHLSELKLELARIGSRQVDSQDFASLRSAFEGMREALSTNVTSPSGVTAEVIQQAARDELQPIASMLVMLIEKIERLERHSGDPEMLEQIERQIAGLSATIGSTASRDPALSELSQAMADLMAEVSTWRHGTIQIAEQAARTAVAQTIEAMRGEFGSSGRLMADELHLAPSVPARPAVERDGPEQSGPRLAPHHGYDTPSSEVGAPAPQEPDAVPAMSDAELRRLNEALLAGPMLSEADRPLPRVPENEVLLEPGAARPRSGSDAMPEADSGGEQRDIKASFIAAARRAAQAAAADADKTRGRPADRGSASLEGRASSDRIRGVLDRLRRPLLVSAAALVVAIGAYRLADELTAEQPQSLASRRAPQNPVVAETPAAPAPAERVAAAPAVSDAFEPTTTSSLAADRPAAPASPAPANPPEAAADTKASAPATANATEAPPQKQMSQLPPAPASVPLPPKQAEAAPSLREAALNGDPAALYELAVRTMEGRGVARDPRAAVAFFEKAGEKNLPIAQYRAGNAYEKGLGVARDVEAARRWYQRAAENGNTRAMHNLAVLMAEGAGGKPDYAGAMSWFQKAAEHGVRDSQFNLAVLYARGLGTQQDLARSYLWFAIAAGQGDDEAGRKRDEVAARLQPSDLTRAKAAVERWRVTAPSPAANEAPSAAAKWSQASGRRLAKA